MVTIAMKIVLAKPLIPCPMLQDYQNTCSGQEQHQHARLDPLIYLQLVLHRICFASVLEQQTVWRIYGKICQTMGETMRNPVQNLLIIIIRGSTKFLDRFLWV